jgi:hypothetical protein
MLKVQSFDIMDSDGMNELLSKHRLASGAHILVTDGKVCIPYEDGQEPNIHQKNSALAEVRNNHCIEMMLAEHSLAVNKIREQEMNDNLSSSEAIKDKKLFEKIEKDLAEVRSLIKMNEAEIHRLDVNIQEANRNML